MTWVQSKIFQTRFSLKLFPQVVGLRPSAFEPQNLINKTITISNSWLPSFLTLGFLAANLDKR